MEKNFFDGCQCLWEAKARYVKIANEYHPVTGKDPITLFLCRLQYVMFSRDPNLGFNRLQVDVQDEFLRYPDIVDKLIGWGLKVELFGTWTWISGDVLPYIDKLEVMGFLYEDSLKSWYLRPPSTYPTTTYSYSENIWQEQHLKKTIEAILQMK